MLSAEILETIRQHRSLAMLQHVRLALFQYNREIKKVVLSGIALDWLRRCIRGRFGKWEKTINRALPR